MRKLKEWLINHFLPLWAKETVYADNRILKQELLKLEQKNKELNAYIDGMNSGIRSLRRITINAGIREDKKE